MFHRGTGLIAVGVALGMTTLTPSARPAEPQSSGQHVIRIGIVQSLFRDVPERLALALMQPFGSLMKSETGFDSDLQPGGSALDLGRRLAEDKVDLAVFQGIEFAWAKQKYPELQPLMVVVNRNPYRRAYLVVGKNAGVHGLADLKGKTLALPRFSHEHCYQFLNGLCRSQGQDPARFFGKIEKSANAEAALDDVVDGRVPAALVEEVPIDCYQRRKPGRYSALKVLRRSERFPASVVAYHAGHLDRAALDRFRDAMLNAPRNPVGRQLLSLWRVTGFIAVPDNYQASLEKIVKLYPAPIESHKATMQVSRDVRRRQGQ